MHGTCCSHGRQVGCTVSSNPCVATCKTSSRWVSCICTYPAHDATVRVFLQATCVRSVARSGLAILDALVHPQTRHVWCPALGPTGSARALAHAPRAQAVAVRIRCVVRRAVVLAQVLPQLASSSSSSATCSWVLSASTPCSRTCGGGLQRQAALCSCSDGSFDETGNSCSGVAPGMSMLVLVMRL